MAESMLQIDGIRERVKRALITLIKPIVRMAIRNGMTYREFGVLSRTCYVQVASEDYGLRGKETNISRVALITGINRKDIKKVRDSLHEGDLPDSASPDRISRILTGWYKDPAFVDAKDQPLALPFEVGSPSFTDLVAKYGSGMAPITLMRELRYSNIIEVDEQQVCRMLKRYYIPIPSALNTDGPLDLVDPALIEHGGSMLNDHATTIYHNLYRDDTASPPRFDRRATNYQVNRDYLESYRELFEERCQNLVEEMDQWLSRHEIREDDNPKKAIRLGVGIYWIQGDDSRQ